MLEILLIQGSLMKLEHWIHPFIYSTDAGFPLGPKLKYYAKD